jgi:hypothetical protein
MKEGEKDIVKLAIRKHGDSFYNEHNSGDFIFEEITTFLDKEGLDLKLIQKGE